jgi:hypothetical protein
MTMNKGPVIRAYANPAVASTWTANQTLNDNVKHIYGTGGDVGIYFDATDLIISAAATNVRIDQGANDGAVLALVSSDVAHGVTSRAKTDEYGIFKKLSATAGGLYVEAFSEATPGLRLQGISTADNTAKTTSASASLVLGGAKKSGTSWGANDSNANLAVIQTSTTTRFIFDAEGSAHADVEWTTFDDHDDLVLINDIEQHLLGVESEVGTYSRHMLEETGIIGKDSWHVEDGKPRAMVNTTKLTMLHHGALMQVGERLASMENTIALQAQELLALKAV